MCMTSIDKLEEELFDAREELVGHAEARGYGERFPDTQSIGDMEEQIRDINDEDDRELLLEKFNRVERLYGEYTAALTSQTASEMDFDSTDE